MHCEMSTSVPDLYPLRHRYHSPSCENQRYLHCPLGAGKKHCPRLTITGLGEGCEPKEIQSDRELRPGGGRCARSKTTTGDHLKVGTKGNEEVKWKMRN